MAFEEIEIGQVRGPDLKGQNIVNRTSNNKGLYNALGNLNKTTQNVFQQMGEEEKYKQRQNDILEEKKRVLYNKKIEDDAKLTNEQYYSRSYHKTITDDKYIYATAEEKYKILSDFGLQGGKFAESIVKGSMTQTASSIALLKGSTYNKEQLRINEDFLRAKQRENIDKNLIMSDNNQHYNTEENKTGFIELDNANNELNEVSFDLKYYQSNRDTLSEIQNKDYSNKLDKMKELKKKSKKEYIKIQKLYQKEEFKESYSFFIEGLNELNSDKDKFNYIKEAISINNNKPASAEQLYKKNELNKEKNTYSGLKETEEHIESNIQSTKKLISSNSYGMSENNYVERSEKLVKLIDDRNEAVKNTHNPKDKKNVMDKYNVIIKNLNKTVKEDDYKIKVIDITNKIKSNSINSNNNINLYNNDLIMEKNKIGIEHRNNIQKDLINDSNFRIVNNNELSVDEKLIRLRNNEKTIKDYQFSKPNISSDIYNNTTTNDDINTIKTEYKKDKYNIIKGISQEVLNNKKTEVKVILDDLLKKNIIDKIEYNEVYTKYKKNVIENIQFEENKKNDLLKNGTNSKINQSKREIQYDNEKLRKMVNTAFENGDYTSINDAINKNLKKLPIDQALKNGLLNEENFTKTMTMFQNIDSKARTKTGRTGDIYKYTDSYYVKKDIKLDDNTLKRLHTLANNSVDLYSKPSFDIDEQENEYNQLILDVGMIEDNVIKGQVIMDINNFIKVTGDIGAAKEKFANKRTNTDWWFGFSHIADYVDIDNEMDDNDFGDVTNGSNSKLLQHRENNIVIDTFNKILKSKSISVSKKNTTRFYFYGETIYEKRNGMVINQISEKEIADLINTKNKDDYNKKKNKIEFRKLEHNINQDTKSTISSEFNINDFEF